MATNSFYQGYSVYQNAKTRTALLVATTVGRVQRFQLGARSRIATVVVVSEGRYLWTKKPIYLELSKRCAAGTTILFGRSADHQSGEHLLECTGSDLRVQIQREGDYRIALPETEDFVKADLRRDPGADLAKAEGAKK